MFIAVFFNRVSAVEFDSGMMFGITVQKQFTKRFGAQVQQNLWINQNFTRYERYMPIVGLHYSIWKNYLKANVYYCYLNQLSETGYRIHRQRYQLGLSGGYTFTHLSVSLLSRFESTYTRNASRNPNNKWRNRAQFSYIIGRQCNWKPFIAAEVFNTLNRLGGNATERVWYEIGVECSLDKSMSIELKLREEQMLLTSPEKLNKYIRTIYNKANDMDRLIDELTFYSKIDTNKIPYNFSKINVAEYFGDCVEEVGLDMETRGIELGYFNYVDEDVVVIADAEQMKRVINNIIGNSLKYLDKKKGILNIRIKDDGDFIQVIIEDNGKGIAAKDLPYIFDRFYRTDSSRNSSKGGSGIGLSIVKKIIEDHGGRIWATSKEGIGTEIHFVLRKYVGA